MPDPIRLLATSLLSLSLLACISLASAQDPPEGSSMLSDDDKAFLDQNFQRFGSAWQEGLSGLDRSFEIRPEVHETSIVLGLTTRLPPQVGFRITVNREHGGMEHTSPGLPDGPELTTEELREVDEILRAAQVLWIVAPANGECVRLDTSQGSEALLEIEQPWVSYRGTPPTPTLETRRLGHRAVFYVRPGYGDLFTAWIDLTARAVEGAAWIDVPADSAPTRLITAEDRAFLDRAMREHGDFGVYGNVTPGLAWLLDHFDVRIRIDDDGWHINSEPRDGHGHFLHFTVEHGTGRIDGVMAGH